MPVVTQLGLITVNLIIGEGRAERAPFLELWPHFYVHIIWGTAGTSSTIYCGLAGGKPVVSLVGFFVENFPASFLSASAGEGGKGIPSGLLLQSPRFMTKSHHAP